MAWGGGKFDKQDKILPGAYFRPASAGSITVSNSGGGGGGSGGGGSGDSGLIAYFVAGESRMVIEGDCVGCTADGCLTIDNEACVCTGDGCLTITTE